MHGGDLSFETSCQENTSAQKIIRMGLFAPGAASCCNGPMSEASRREVRAGLELCLARLWRYALMLTRANDAAEDLVQATCRGAPIQAFQRPAPLVDKLRDVVGLYVDPPAHAIVLSVDEKSQIQALDRTQPGRRNVS